MSIKESRKNNYVSVKKLINTWESGGLKSVKSLLDNPDSIIEKDSWVEKIKKLIEDKKLLSVNEEIKLISNIFYKEEKTDED